jgi:hypothetical protein
MPPDVYERRRSSSSDLSGFSAGDKYEGPDADTLTALLREKKPDRTHEVEFNSRESTPFVMLLPPGVEHWRSVARAARDDLARFIGKSAADDIRRSIPYMHYWKTEAEHYASLITGASMDQLEILQIIEDPRYSISDIYYWQTEAMHYQRHTSGTNCDHVEKNPPTSVSTERHLHKVRDGSIQKRRQVRERSNATNKLGKKSSVSIQHSQLQSPHIRCFANTIRGNSWQAEFSTIYSSTTRQCKSGRQGTNQSDHSTNGPSPSKPCENIDRVSI